VLYFCTVIIHQLPDTQHQMLQNYNVTDCYHLSRQTVTDQRILTKKSQDFVLFYSMMLIVAYI